MADLWTAERVLALAPDASSAKSGKELSARRKWVTLGRGEHVVWGECQGSAATPYRTQIDLSEPAFKCSCPSRKFPCKHGLGLFLLLVADESAVSAGDSPDWVKQWVASRGARAEQKAKKKEEAAAAPVDPAAAAKRAAERQRKVTAGLAELEVWLKDLVRRGLGAAQSEPYTFWETPAARMVDAQAPGVARILREMPSIPSSGHGWQERMLHRLSQVHLLIEGFERIEALPPEVQADVRSLIGWTQSQEELLAMPGVRDTWMVLGQRVEVEERLRAQHTWLYGAAGKRCALVLQFAHGATAFESGLVAGTQLDAELVFYSGASALRAMMKQRHGAAQPLAAIPGYATICEALNAYANLLAVFPWLERFPMPLTNVTPLVGGEAWSIRDGEGKALPLSPRFARGWEVLAVSGGRPVSTFGEWDGQTFLPMGVSSDGQYVRLATATEGQA